jgi:hypothetical protein
VSVDYTYNTDGSLHTVRTAESGQIHLESILATMSETKSVQVRFPDGTISKCAIELSVSSTFKLVFSGIDLETQEFFGEDFFDALIGLRLELEKRWIQLLCAGSRPDVWPSGMGRDMSGGRKAYVTHMDAPSRESDLVDIFDYADPASVGSVAEQKAFHEEFTRSVRKKLNQDCYGKAVSVRRMIQVLAPDGGVTDCEVEISGIPPCEIVLFGIALERQEFSGKDLFGAFIELRLELEKFRLQLLCVGCQPEVVSLGFTRTINGEIRACVLYTNAQSLGGDLIDIFEYSAPENVVSVAKQEAFHKEWKESLRKNK